MCNSTRINVVRDVFISFAGVSLVTTGRVCLKLPAYSTTIPPRILISFTVRVSTSTAFLWDIFHSFQANSLCCCNIHPRLNTKCTVWSSFISPIWAISRFKRKPSAVPSGASEVNKPSSLFSFFAQYYQKLFFVLGSNMQRAAYLLFYRSWNSIQFRIKSLLTFPVLLGPPISKSNKDFAVICYH